MSVDLTKQCRWVDTKNPAKVITNFEFNGRRYVVAAAGGALGFYDLSCFENIPDPPPKTFDPDKLRRAIAHCHSKPDEKILCAETNQGEPRYNAVESPINREFVAFDGDGELYVCNFSGIEGGGPSWANSHLPEPEFREVHVVLTTGGFAITSTDKDYIETQISNQRSYGTFDGTATVRVYREQQRKDGG